MKYLILGFCLSFFVVPFIEGILQIYSAAVEYYTVKITAKTYAIQQTLNTEEMQPASPSFAIGFAPPSIEEETEEDIE